MGVLWWTRAWATTRLSSIRASAPEQQLPAQPRVPRAPAPSKPLYSDPQQDRILEEFGIEVPIGSWPAPPKRFLRISAQLYNTEEQYARLAEVVRRVLLGGE